MYMYELEYDEDQHCTDDKDVYDIAIPVDLIQDNFYNSTRQANVN